jgi:uncharacterized transporter YbjL
VSKTLRHLLPQWAWITWLQRIRPHQWAWLNFKLALGIGWSTGILFVTPQLIQETNSQTNLQVWSYGTVLGTLISIVGLFMSEATNYKIKDRGYRIELIGVALFAGGPLQYWIIQLTFVAEDFQARYTLGWFAYAMLSAVLVRVVIILSSIRRGTDDCKKANL